MRKHLSRKSLQRLRASTHSVGVLEWMVEGVGKHPEGRELFNIVQVPHRLHVVHQEAIVQQHPVLVVDAFTARDLDGRRPALHAG